MKKSLGAILCTVLVVSILAVNIPLKVYAGVFSIENLLLLLGKDKSEKEIYLEKKEYSHTDLLNEMIEIELNLDKGNEIALLPHAIALIEKEGKISENEITKLLSDYRVGPVLESALIKILLAKKGSNDNLIRLLDSDELQIESKELIVDLADLDVEELSKIYIENDDSVAISAMKRIMIENPNQAYLLSKAVLSKKSTTDSKLISALLGLGEFYDTVKDDDKNKEETINIMKDIYSSSDNSLVKDNVIYSLTRMNDFEVFTFIINNEEIDLLLKVSTIERNSELLIKMITDTNNSLSVYDAYIIDKAMRMHPIVEIGEALREAFSNNKHSSLFDNKENLLDFIEKNGIRGALKYD